MSEIKCIICRPNVSNLLTRKKRKVFIMEDTINYSRINMLHNLRTQLILSVYFIRMIKFQEPEYSHENRILNLNSSYIILRCFPKRPLVFLRMKIYFHNIFCDEVL